MRVIAAAVATVAATHGIPISPSCSATTGRTGKRPMVAAAVARSHAAKRLLTRPSINAAGQPYTGDNQICGGRPGRGDCRGNDRENAINHDAGQAP
ncbi:Hypothetical protein DIP1827 [Corynebacterium diphtheriae]|uniref:Uncharacterized protein n=1 Tax=Corynebacterium diphtheriae (strain ATCC 700971 / NCTC 13129 / Biotype gravis) TaxID=257309 RepID=Q6NFQ9_CORDI|nr:Hypothetical protein DIP1827 [Corynebacterium diphtheriae]